ncbi:phage integrase N-terminal domain-containing protein [Isoalcanivorax pacificus]|uniref:phage integrase N-terminal domain-containing protein n=1 Tax=Isoalcanivorax pacificus TaxID=1306787 RepID=UPI0002E72F71|nr:phage integrase N-terminal domain-containing protein [Isoalcanivorax pacificus]
MKASSLKGKHVQALLDRWQGEGLSSGTIKNRLSHLRWWAEKIGESGTCRRTTRNSAWPSAAM